MKRTANYDRIMILSRQPDFRQGLNDLSGGFYLDDAKAFADHWGIEVAFLDIYRELCEQADNLRTQEEFLRFADDVNSMPLFRGAHGSPPARVIKHEPDLLEVTRGIRYDFEEFPEGIQGTTIAKSPEHSDTRHLKESRFLTVDLDLFATKEDIMKAVGLLVDHYKTELGDSGQRRKSIEIDHWYAYRQHVEKNRPLHEIASEIIGSAPRRYQGEDPVGAAQQAVHRAARKAKTLLSE